MDTRTLMVTGGSGFIGRALCQALGAAHVGHVRAPTRQQAPLARDTDWSAFLHGVDTVVHLAARVHVMHEMATDPLAAFREVNVAGTVRLAEQAAAAGVRRFVFVSSIKVNGENTPVGRAFRADDIPAPQDPYGQSKCEAEHALRQLLAGSATQLVIIRPVLVYGPGVGGNFISMMRALQRGVPLPFGAVDNRRSLVSIDNLISLIVTCLDHPSAAGETFLVSDGDDISLSRLLRELGLALQRPARLVRVPTQLLRWSLGALRRPALAQRLLDSLQVDISKNHALLGWQPTQPVAVALARTASAFQERAQ